MPLILKVAKITIMNTQILVDDTPSLDSFKNDLADQFGVIPSDIHFIYSETNEEIIISKS